ncbi:carboxypeptidase-like regulatory domain-containing protein [uncultured Treponema sp.]|uniref:carboxypeptidase-like regulatory domain-containing protein n=1 Tax=uncultured Treponema sp. TaxID=162155 RepID=UPI002587F6BA|nr:carboxypeptidase-like regulatory domain-containing protein [uncultured Treponema sp.]
MNTKKLALALFPLLLAFASCMNIDGSSDKEGAIRVTLPESGSRRTYTLSKDNPLYEVSLMQGEKTLKTLSSESTGGGDFVFDELEPGTYKIVVTARQQDGTFLARNSAEVEVTAGETQNCPITLILAGNKGKVFNSDYYVLQDTSHVDFLPENEISSSTTVSNSVNKTTGTEDIDGNKYYAQFTTYSSSSNVFIYKNNISSSPVDIGTSTEKSSTITDFLYYDTVNSSLWVGLYSSNGFYFANNINKLFYEDGSQPGSITLNTPCTLSGILIYPNATYTAFAASGTELYIAYTNDGTSYLQRATITGNNNDGFTITAKGEAQSTQSMGVDGQITDIVIHYDGYVYVLVSQTGSKNFTDMYMVNNLISGSEETTVYSRGAIVRLEPTSSGFKLSAKTGWTEDSRIIASSNKDKNPFTSGSDSDNYTFYDVNAYIPEYSERNSHFYGPRRFVAIKPKELAIADCGANIVMPDYGSKKRGKLFKHNRIVKVDLYKFALESSSVIDLNSINFSNLSLSGSIESVTNFNNLEDNEEK